MTKWCARNAAGVFRSLAVILVSAVPAAADKIDDIIGSSELRCGVMLDFPPAGFRNAQNEPDGFDVQYCQDMAAALGVEAVIVETPSADRIPALVTNRIDVSVASASSTLERAKTVAFSIPYIVYTNVVVAKKDTDIDGFDSLQGKRVGGVTGTTAEQSFLEVNHAWGSEATDYIGYGTEAEQYLALSQGKVDAIIGSSAQAADLIATGKYPDLEVKGEAPFAIDLCAIATKKEDHAFLRWVDLFVWHQQKSGRYAELYKQYFRSDAVPSLVIKNTYY